MLVTLHKQQKRVALQDHLLHRQPSLYGSLFQSTGMDEPLLLEARIMNERVIWRLTEDYIFEVVGEVIHVGVAVVGEVVERGMAEKG